MPAPAGLFIIFGVAFVWFTTHFAVASCLRAPQITVTMCVSASACLLILTCHALQRYLFCLRQYALPENTKYTITARTTILFTENWPVFFAKLLFLGTRFALAVRSAAPADYRRKSSSFIAVPDIGIRRAVGPYLGMAVRLAYRKDRRFTQMSVRG